jgi:hypothetical protein
MTTIPTSDIEVGDRLRAVSEAQVEALIASITDVGLLNPITVFKTKAIQSGAQVDAYGLVAGAHRLEACKRLGLADIPAFVVDLSDLERQIAECDENLCGSKLTASEKAMFTKRRKQAYEALHPETRHGVNQHSSTRKVCDSSERFTADTAEKTGQSERLVQLNAERGNRISDRALETLRGTTLDKGVYLDKLKSVPEQEQLARVKADLQDVAKQIKRAEPPISPDEVIKRQVDALMSAWNRASPEARRDFMERIDTPVFDRGCV